MTVTQDTGTNMAVRVLPGSARISTGTSPGNYGYFVAIDTSGGETVTITTANASNPRNDLIVAYVDLAVTPSTASANNPNNMLKLAAVAGTPAATPADPTNSAIQAAVGASNPYIILARVRVNAAVTQITTANCTDLRTMATTSPAAKYKFSVYRSAAYSSGANTTVRVNFDTKLFDTSNNFDNTSGFRFVAPVSGFYQFNWQVTVNSGSTDTVASLYKNGVLLVEGVNTNSSGTGTGGSTIVQVSATDFFEIWLFTSASIGLRLTNKGVAFSGYLVSPS